uniref:Uncharacterized protein n=1 Tax=Romanomermis culicivorax TaxID=13658 RepID=A0A915HTQ1_ROMCU
MTEAWTLAKEAISLKYFAGVLVGEADEASNGDVEGAEVVADVEGKSFFCQKCMLMFHLCLLKHSHASLVNT